jgi:hypothetical protein
MKINLTKSIGMWLLAIWLILRGLDAFIPAITSLGVVFPLLALLAGIFIILGI